MTNRLPNQRWQIFSSQDELATQLAEATGLSPILGQVLINRGIETPEQAMVYLNPESQFLPSPLEEFPDLAVSVELLQQAISQNQKIAICGDYDADGMTSTALLLRSLRWLGAKVDYAIPSRMKDGYGINLRIVEEFHAEGVGLILTVDNGISAFAPIVRARELGIKVIVTDHHDLPEKLPPANAILNPKLIPESSPYRGLAGVGVAYVLAVTLAQQLGKIQGLVKPLLELFTLGTIADLAPLTGVNRRWVKRGLQQLPQSQLAGVQALIQIAGVQQGTSNGQQGSRDVGAGLTKNSSISQTTSINPPSWEQGIQNPKSNPPLPPCPPLPLIPRGGPETPPPAAPPLIKGGMGGSQNPKSLKPEDIGFRLGPRINAVGRIADPQIVIDLLTTDDMGVALERAMQCEQINQQRQQLCEQIEREAVAWCEERQINLQQERVLVIVQAGWHHGVIGIVASRLVERYGVPVFIGTYEDEQHIRGSARGIPEFHVFEALEFCKDVLAKYGGHKAAGGFSLPAQNLASLRSRLSTFARKCLKIEHLKPLLKIDAKASLDQINLNLYRQIDALHPCGIENPDPIFFSPNVRVSEQQIVGKSHLKLTLSQEVGNQYFRIKAIAWRWSEFFPLPPRLDIAYKLRENTWNGDTSVELELVGVRLPATSSPESSSRKAEFFYNERRYTCSLLESVNELRIRNPEGKVLAVQQGQKTGLLGTTREDASAVDITQPRFYHLIKAALQALDVAGNKP